MSYMIKHSINAKPFKMATAFFTTNYTISTGVPRNLTLSLDTLVQSNDMGLTLANNQITLVAGKTYIIYYKVGISNGTENRGAQVFIQKNGVTVSAQPTVQAVTTSGAVGSGAWITPINVATAVVSASAGDYISFLYSRDTGALYVDTVNSGASRAFILEIA